MSCCNFCKREFESPQGAKAHLRWCQAYLDLKKDPMRQNRRNGSASNFSKALPSYSPASTAASNPLAGLLEQFTQQFAGPDEATRRKQKREGLLAGLCSSVVDWCRPLDGIITPDMAATAKVAILDELGALKIEDMPQTELTLRGTAIRDRVFAPYLQRQHEQREHQREHLQQNTLRSQRETATQLRRTKRKGALIELGITRALTAASSRGLTGLALVLLEWEVRMRLDAWLVGDETEQQVDETISASIERPLLDWETRSEHLRNAKREHILNQCLTLAAPVAEAAWPWMRDMVIKKVYEHFGVPPMPPPTDTTTSEPSSAPPTEKMPPARPIRRRRRQAVPPNTTPTEMVIQDDAEASVPPANQSVAS